jgi:predicted RNA-binding Zn ribbon-like protein
LEAGVITRSTGEHLRQLAAAAPARAPAALREAIRLRETIYDVFSAVAHRQAIPGTALAHLNASAQRAAGHAQVVQANRRFSSEWIEPERHLDSMLWPVTRAAAELLLGAEMDDVRQCASETCSWLFVDRSKNHRRRWCDMKVCGNRDKARKYYQRQHPSSP